VYVAFAMTELPIARLPRRAPLRVVSLPPLAALQAAAERRFRRGPGRVFAKAARATFNAVHERLGLPATGLLALDRGGGNVATLRFDARNTHFAALARAGAAGYEPETLALLDALVPDDGTFFDVGANWGYFALAIASRPGFAGRVVAFEPAASVRSDMARLVRAAGLAERIACRGEALSDGSGTGRLAGGRHSALARLVGEDRGEHVAVARLDELGLAPPDAIKIDVEGHEARALAGAAKTVARHRPAIVMESWYRADDAPASLAPLRWLVGQGYALYRPLWCVEGPAGRHLSPVPPSGDGPAALALYPFAPGERLAFGADFNLLACPAERRDALHRTFRPETL
jgi:FkbM family methyltransferase